MTERQAVKVNTRAFPPIEDPLLDTLSDGIRQVDVDHRQQCAGSRGSCGASGTDITRPRFETPPPKSSAPSLPTATPVGAPTAAGRQWIRSFARIHCGGWWRTTLCGILNALDRRRARTRRITFKLLQVG